MAALLLAVFVSQAAGALHFGHNHAQSNSLGDCVLCSACDTPWVAGERSAPVVAGSMTVRATLPPLPLPPVSDYFTPISPRSPPAC